MRDDDPEMKTYDWNDASVPVGTIWRACVVLGTKVWSMDRTDDGRLNFERSWLLGGHIGVDDPEYGHLILFVGEVRFAYYESPPTRRRLRVQEVIPLGCDIDGPVYVVCGDPLGDEVLPSGSTQ